MDFWLHISHCSNIAGDEATGQKLYRFVTFYVQVCIILISQINFTIKVMYKKDTSKLYLKTGCLMYLDHFHNVPRSFYLWFAGTLTSLLLFPQDQPPTMCQQFATGEKWWTPQHPLCEKHS